MTVFEGAVDATFAAFRVYALYTPAGGDPVPVRVIERRPDTILGFGETRIHAETATFEVRVSEVASPRPGDQLTVDGNFLRTLGPAAGGRALVAHDAARRAGQDRRPHRASRPLRGVPAG